MDMEGIILREDNDKTKDVTAEKSSDSTKGKMSRSILFQWFYNMVF